MKVSELQGGWLDYWVARAVGKTVNAGSHTGLISVRDDSMFCGYIGQHADSRYPATPQWSPSTNWAQGGPLMDKFHASLYHFESLKQWKAVIGPSESNDATAREFGESALLALCRAVVAWKFGEEVDEVVV